MASELIRVENLDLEIDGNLLLNNLGFSSILKDLLMLSAYLIIGIILAAIAMKTSKKE